MTVRTRARLLARLSNARHGNEAADFRDLTQSVFPKNTLYTPVLTASGTAFALGNGSSFGAYAEDGDFVYYAGRIVMGSTTTFGTGNYSLSLPVAADMNSSTLRAFGIANYNDSGTGNYTGVVQVTADGSTLVPFSLKPTVSDFIGQVAATNPMTWAQNDVMAWSLWYPKRAAT